MALVRWEPAREISSLQQEVNRLFGTFFDSPGGTELAARRWVPAMDLLEEDDRYVLRADLPGLSEKDVNIELDERVLTISGERRSESVERKEGYHRVERASGRFSRSLTLPAGIEADAIEARFENGVLEVRIPKPEQRKPRRVEIKAGGGSTIEGRLSDESKPAEHEAQAA